MDRDELREALCKLINEDALGDMHVIDFEPVYTLDLRPEDERSNGLLTEPPKADRVLKTREAAEYLGISVWTLRDHVHAGRLHYLPGGAWRFDRDDLDEFVKQSKERQVNL